MSYATARSRTANGEINKLFPEDRSVHEWYRFVLSFPPHLVQRYLERFGVTPGQCVLDPFCGTGTVLVEVKKQEIQSIGIEANPVAHLASRVKVDWAPDPDELIAHARWVTRQANAILDSQGIEDLPLLSMGDPPAAHLRALPPEQELLLLKGSISPLPLHKTLVLLQCLEDARDDRFLAHEQVALAKALAYSVSNLHFGPEVGVGAPKPDAPVVNTWLSGITAMCDDLRDVRHLHDVPAQVHLADSRSVLPTLEPQSINAVITSPPYPNEKDYTRTTRLESVLLGFVTSKADLRQLKKGLVRSNSRGVYAGDSDDEWVRDNDEVQRIAEAIEARRIELGKTSGFERMYARVTRLYFGGMARHLADLRHALRPGAQLAYVVGDQASYLRIMIRTGQILAGIAQSLGYEVVGIDLFRTRLATATREQLREEVVVLRWPG